MGLAGWRYSFQVPATKHCPPPTCLDCVREHVYTSKYDIAQYVRDNWFVLAAVMRDQYGLDIHEECSLAFSYSRPCGYYSPRHCCKSIALSISSAT